MSDIEKKPLETELTDEQSEAVNGGFPLCVAEASTEDTARHQMVAT